MKGGLYTALPLLIVATSVSVASWDDDSHYVSLGLRKGYYIVQPDSIYFVNLAFMKRLYRSDHGELIQWRGSERVLPVVTVTLTATDYPCAGTRWVQMDNNFPLQNILIALLGELRTPPDS
jgi:hypothetical protein